jgi:hypothetical protein
MLRIRKNQFSNKLFILSLLGFTLAAPTNYVFAQTPTVPSPSPTQSQPVKTTNPVAQKLLGQWQGKESSSPENITFVFTPEGKLFGITSSGTVLEFEYQINSTAKPMHLDVLLPDTKETVLTIFELTSDGKLKLQLDGTNPGKPRPKSFSPNVTIFEKVSDSTTVPNKPQNNSPDTQPLEGEGK